MDDLRVEVGPVDLESNSYPVTVTGLHPLVPVEQWLAALAQPLDAAILAPYRPPPLDRVALAEACAQAAADAATARWLR